jgi:hypothetical protein
VNVTIYVEGGGDNTYPILLVDSEDPVQNASEDPDADSAWKHLTSRDGWACPHSVNADQAQLMTTCMETWIMADRAGMHTIFGTELQQSALLPEEQLETRNRHQVQNALEHATRNCGRNKAYRKGRRSFQVLAQLSPDTLTQHLPHFRRLRQTLERYSRNRS